MTRANIVITGASSGLGEGMARRFAAMGRNLALCARRLDRLEELRAELVAAHPGIQVAIRQLDVNDHEAVFKAFQEFRAELGSLDRVIVNAGVGKGQPLGTGRFDANRHTAMTNFVAALAQIEAAMEIFRDQRAGHLVLISSVSAVRGLARNKTTYSATKAGLSALGAGLRAELHRGPIKVSTILPGYIASELSAESSSTPLMVSAEKGHRLLVRAIEREPAKAYVPAWPWTLMAALMRIAPDRLIAKF